MPALIRELITGPDAFEFVGEQIAAILKVESATQAALADAAHEDPKLWTLRVFRERAAPWESWTDAPDTDVIGDDGHVPIVNVRFDTDSVDERRSNVVERQTYVAVYHVDVFGYGKSTGTEYGHEAGDQRAAKECHRAMRLVRRILMAGHYTYLGLPRGEEQRVWKRMVRSRTVFQPQLSGRAVQHVVGGRISFQVDLTETSPQVQGYPLELVALTVLRAETGEVMLSANFGLTPVVAAVAPDGLSIALTYYAPLDPASVSASAAYKLTGTGSVVNAVSVAGAVVTLGVDTPILGGQVVLLDYLPGVTPIKFLDGNPVADLSEFQVTNTLVAA